LLELMQSMRNAEVVYQKLMQWYVIQYAFLWRNQFKNVNLEEFNQLTYELDDMIDHMHIEVDRVCDHFQLEKIDQLHQAVPHEEWMEFSELFYRIVDFEKEMDEWNRKMDVITDAKIALDKK
jgi:hypothetical protein